ncbi:zinc-dependent metalloprotease [Pseudoclavibacter alba]|uniref:Zinc-dependent metalloprotease n=1 Tax=Pseudoclavibacter albus TaxID=272241 RepID=A0ABT2HXU1_9MICO|nr:zinc-dependent metalloprotease [Pseudoclavibacter alba]MCT2043127.1 zinc-dependent metalloprotease [Pseudoclavibacter alba]
MSDNNGRGPEDDDAQKDPAEELREALRNMLHGGQGFDASKLAGVAGLPGDPALVQQLVAQMQRALMQDGKGFSTDTAAEHAKQIVSQGHREVSDEEKTRYEHTFRLAELWLAEATTIGELVETPRTMTRREWVGESAPTWASLAEPVADSIADALMRALTEQLPDEMLGMVGQSNTMLRNIGGAMFSMQLGQVIGDLAKEVISGGDIGMPVLTRRRATLIPQNVDAFGEGLDIPASEVELYLAVREVAHARLFQHAKWLPLHLTSQVIEFAHGIQIDVRAIDDLASQIDPSSPEQIREALSNGSFIPPRTPQQEAALARIETMLALVEGWVDVVTQEAVERLPKGEALGEMMRRRRASGGPAERAFSSLVGLELRPRRLREASAMWRLVGEAHGVEERDKLWQHFDGLPTSDDIDNPMELVRRIGVSDFNVGDEMDAALESLLNDPSSFGEAPEGGSIKE